MRKKGKYWHHSDSIEPLLPEVKKIGRPKKIIRKVPFTKEQNDLIILLYKKALPIKWIAKAVDSDLKRVYARILKLKKVKLL